MDAGSRRFIVVGGVNSDARGLLWRMPQLRQPLLYLNRRAFDKSRETTFTPRCIHRCMSSATTIEISYSVRHEMDSLKPGGMSYSKFIQELLDEYESDGD